MSTESGQTADPYAATAGAYDLMNAPARPAQLAALEAWLPAVDAGHGPVLDIGAGSGLNTAEVLERLADCEVLALEPSPAMRSLIMGRLAGRPDWFSRVTVRPEGFFSAPLPERIGGAIMLGVIGHFRPEERGALLRELGRRLPVGGAVLIDLQMPETPQRVERFEFAGPKVGQLTYQVLGEAWPAAGEEMRWQMTYLVLDGSQVLSRSSTDHRYRHPAPEVVAGQAAEAGLSMRRLPVSSFWMLVRR